MMNLSTQITLLSQFQLQENIHLMQNIHPTTAKSKIRGQ